VCYRIDIEAIECFLTNGIQNNAVNFKIAVTSALIDMNDLTAFTINRNSLKYDDLSLQVHSY